MRPDARRGLARLYDSPRVVGILALLIGSVAVFISYGAQNGLPLAGTYHVSVDVPDAAKITPHSDVRIGGARVGQVLHVQAMPRAGSRPPFARLDLGLEQRTRPLPADTTAEVRLASVLGGKYLALVPGRSRRGLAAGAVLPLAQGIRSIDIDEALQIFRPRSRTAIRRVVSGLGDALAGRGRGLNSSTHRFAASLPAADRVLRLLVSDATDLRGFLTGAAGASAALAAAAPDLAALLPRLDTTVAAVDRAGDAVDRTLVALPPAEDRITAALRAAGPALADAAAITRSLSPAARRLPRTVATLDRVAAAATPVATLTKTVAAPLDKALVAVDAFGRSTTSKKALAALGTNDLATFGGSAFIGLGAILQTAADAQLHCNSLGLWVRNLASVASVGDSGGNWLRMLPVLDVPQMLHSKEPATNLHVNVYPNQGASECEAGNEPYLPGRRLGNPAGAQAALTGGATP